MARDGEHGRTFSTRERQLNGTDSFTFKANDGRRTLTSRPSTSRQAVNDAPVATGGFASGNEDSVITGTLARPIRQRLATYSGVAQAAHGSVMVNWTDVQLHANANFNGTDSFTFKANDGRRL